MADAAVRQRPIGEDWYRAAVDALQRGVVVHQADGRVVASNASAERLLGPTLELIGPEAAGNPFLRPVREDGSPLPPDDGPTTRAIKSGQAQTDVVVGLPREDGTVTWVSVDAHPLRRAGDAQPYAVVTTVANIDRRWRAEQQAALHEALLNQVRNAVIATELDGTITFWNTFARDFYQWDAAEVFGRDLFELVVPEHAEAVAEQMMRAIDDRGYWEGELSVRRKDGTSFPAQMLTTVTRDASGAPIGLIAVSADIAERKRAEQALQRSEARFQSLFQNVSDIIAVLAEDGHLSYISPSVERVWGYRPDELLGTNLLERIHADDAERVREALHRAVCGHEPPVSVEFRVRLSDGSWRYAEAVAVDPDEPSVGGIVLTAHDTTERKRLEEQLTRQAFYDALTGLPNRSLFMDRLEHGVAATERNGGGLAVLFLDLDGFKLINDSLGHAAGDTLLVAVGRRLNSTLRPGDTVARFGGDEFTVLLDGVSSAEDALRIADRILAELRAPITLEGREVFVTGSAGIALSGGAAPVRPDDLVRQADIALYQAKGAGKARAVVFDPAIHDVALNRLDMESDLRGALERGELRLDYQPEVDLATGEIVGLEALVRWQHPTRGLLRPEEFLPIAEESDLIVPIGQWLLTEACRRARSWSQANAGRPPVVSVNLSARQFQQPNLPAQIEALLDLTELPAHCLRLEVTESVLLGAETASERTLARLKAIGVRLAIDDFGTGYSSLNCLRRFAVDALKIDGSLVAALDGDATVAAIVRAIVLLGGELGMTITAEGVEDAAQLARIRAVGCGVAQGAYFSEPLPVDQIPSLLRGNASPSAIASEGR